MRTQQPVRTFPARHAPSTVVLAGLLCLLGLLASGPTAVALPSPSLAAPSLAAAPVATPASVPARILSLSASSTQMLYAIGAGPQVVGVDKYSTYPAQAPRTSLTGYETSAEDYLRYRPDLVLLAFNEGTMVQQLGKLGIRALVLPPATDLAAVYSQLAELGRATGHQKGAASTTAQLRSFIGKEVKMAGNRGHGQTYFVELSPKPLYTATSNTFIGAELGLFGLSNIADKAGHGNAYPQVSNEYLLSANPTWVFLADTVCCRVTPSSFGARPGFSALRATKDGHVVGVNDSVASQWGPHTIEQFLALVDRELSA